MSGGAASDTKRPSWEPPYPPGLFPAQADLNRWYAARRAAAPKWWFDRGYVNVLAEFFLPQFCAAVGTGRALFRIEFPKWWPFDLEPLRMAWRIQRGHLRDPKAVPPWHVPDRILVLESEPLPDARPVRHTEEALLAYLDASPRPPLLCLDEVSREWCVAHPGGTILRTGGDLLDLACWRWNLTPAKAAWRIARLTHRASPMM